MIVQCPRLGGSFPCWALSIVLGCDEPITTVRLGWGVPIADWFYFSGKTIAEYPRVGGFLCHHEIADPT